MNMQNKKKILISGGTGFVGSNLIRLLLVNNFDCINIGRSISSLCRNINWNLIDKLDDSKVNEQIDTIIHCASIIGKDCECYPIECIDVNIRSTLQLLEYSVRKSVKHFVYISTGGVYRYSESKLTEEDTCVPVGLYSRTKYFSEKLCEEYNKYFPVTIVRLFFPYGANQTGRLFKNLIDSILRDGQVILNRDGKPYINPVHIEDVCNIIKFLVNIETGGLFNVCGNEIISIKELSEIFRQKLGVKRVNYVFKDINVSNILGNNEKVVNATKYKFMVNLDKGIDNIIYNYTNDI